MNSPTERLGNAGIDLPAPFAAPPGVELSFEPVLVRDGSVWLSGSGPTAGSDLLMQGVVGEDLTVDEGAEAARLTALAAFATLERELGSLDQIATWNRVACYINSAPRLPGLALTRVADGFSDLIIQIWGDDGRHARVAPGVHALPFNLPVVVEAHLSKRPS